jgi:excisionase family DNA binding protein
MLHMITVPEAAIRIGRHPETIRRWIRSGRLRSQRVGTQHLVDPADLDVLTEPATTPVPDAWTIADDGTAVLGWEALVRDGRRDR